jgi:uncharacterized membrane protein
MQGMEIVSSLLRWIHIVAGIVWIGHLYFFNFVNGPFAGALDADTKRKVAPELMPRALYWFRWGAAWTWVSGILLLLIVFYHGGITFDAEYMDRMWSAPMLVMLALTLLAPFPYDLLMKRVAPKNAMAAVVIAFLCIVVITWLMAQWAHFSYRATLIHIGGMLGTIMAFNVWYRIWPAQQKIIAAVKSGTAPDAALVAMAGLRSRQNTYMSLPLVWAMMNQHSTWAASWWFMTPLAVLFGWWIGTMLFRRAPKVKGF